MILIDYLDIIYLFANAFRVFTLNLLFEGLFSKNNLKYSVNTRRVIMVGYYVLNSGVYLFIQNSMVTLVSNIVLFALLTVPYRGSVLRRLFSVCAAFILGLVCEGIVGRTAMGVMDNMETVMVTTYVLSNFLLYLLTISLRRILKGKEEILFKDHEWIILIIIPLISSIADVVLLMGGYEQWVNVTVICCLFLINVVFFLVYGIMVEKCEVELQNAMLRHQNQAYHQQLSMIRTSTEEYERVKHDFKNHLIALKSVVGTDGNENFRNYINSLEHELSAEDKFVETGNHILDGLLNYKLKVMKDLKTTMKIQVNIPKDLFLDDFEGVIVIGNLLDNAIEALEKSKKKEFAFELKYDRGFLFLHSKNAFDGNLVYKDHRFATTKNTKGLHGIGINNIKRIVEKYNGEMKITTDDQWFDVEITMFT